MKNRYHNRKTSYIRTIIAIIVLMFCMSTTAQEKASSGFLEKTKRAATKTGWFIDYVLNDVDTMYVAKNQYNLIALPQYTLDGEHYRLHSMADGKQSIDITSDNRHKLRLNVGWRWLIVGYSITLKGKSPQSEFNSSIFSARFGLDLFYRKCNGGYNISGLNGFYNGNTPLQNFNKEFDGLLVKQIGVGLHYAFNKRFSYAAAYGLATRQRRSAGSLILGAGYNRQQFTLDLEGLDQMIGGQMADGFKFQELCYNDMSIYLGYCYNWVFAKNFLASLSLAPAVGCKIARAGEDGNHNASIGFDLTSRASVVYNTGRYYAGCSFVSHTYNYNKEDFSILNSFGILKMHVGYYFWRRKK